MKFEDNSLELSRDALFPTMVWTADLPESEVHNEKLVEGILDWKKATPGIVRSNEIIGWHSDVNMHMLPEFSKFTNFIWLCLEGVFKDCSYKGHPSITTMWGNVNQRYSFNRPHLHPESIISGVYYVQVPRNSGRLRLFTPNNHCRMLSGGRQNTSPPLWTEPEIVYTASARKLIMFPSEIVHEVEPNRNDDYEIDNPEGWRISIAFNCSQADWAESALLRDHG